MKIGNNYKQVVSFDDEKSQIKKPSTVDISLDEMEFYSVKDLSQRIINLTIDEDCENPNKLIKNLPEALAAKVIKIVAEDTDKVTKKTLSIISQTFKNLKEIDFEDTGLTKDEINQFKKANGHIKVTVW